MNEQQMKALADESLNEAVRQIQDKLGVETGDFAGLYLSGQRWEIMTQILVGYICAEIMEGKQ